MTHFQSMTLHGECTHLLNSALFNKYVWKILICTSYRLHKHTCTLYMWFIKYIYIYKSILFLITLSASTQQLKISKYENWDDDIK